LAGGDFDIHTAFEGYDIIGDVHGCAASLERLLQRLDYRKVGGVYGHKCRQAIFVGDIVDRGPRIREALHLVYDMVAAGAAQMVMGNHEYNAIGYTTRAKPGTGRQYLREHNKRHNRLIAETLEQFANYGEEWRGFLDWFKTLPLFLEMPDFRVVHACWDHRLIDAYRRRYNSNQVDMEFIHSSVDKNSFAGQLMDRLTRGTDMPLPNNMVMTSHDGYVRRFFRTKFWGRHPKIYNDLVFQPDPLPEEVGNARITDQDRQRICSYGPEQPPLFIGHYWLQGRPRPITPNVACLDYSAVKYGRLVAYRMDGEQHLQADKFVWVYVDPKDGDPSDVLGRVEE